MTEFMFSGPTPRAEWVRAGDVCLSMTGMRGEVLKVVVTSPLPYAVVRWPNGYTGRSTITTLRKAPKETR